MYKLEGKVNKAVLQEDELIFVSTKDSKKKLIVLNLKNSKTQETSVPDFTQDFVIWK